MQTFIIRNDVQPFGDLLFIYRTNVYRGEEANFLTYILSDTMLEK
jgi:hypothetical protein